MSAEQTNASPGLLWELLPKAVTAIVSLSALGYFIGWRETQAYYTAIGATWAASSIPPLTLLQLSANTIAAIATAGFLSLVLLSDNQITTRKLSWICGVVLLLAALCLGLSQGLFGKLSISGAYAFASVGSTLCAVAAGLTLTELYGHVRHATTRISSNHLWLVYWFVLPGLFWAPDRLGQARALRDTDIATSPLPIVTLESTQAPGVWRLVQLIEDKALLVQLSAKEPTRLFKIVEAKEVKAIGLIPQENSAN